MPVLGTKLPPPRPRRRLVQRARLTDRLRADGGEGPRLVLVAAPAGFGKTTLLTQWLAAESSQRSVAWVALDPGDADLRLVMTHLGAAGPAAPAVSPARPWRARGGAGRRPQVHHRRGRGVPQRGDGAAARSRARD